MRDILFTTLVVVLAAVWLRWLLIVIFALRQVGSESRERRAHLKKLRVSGWLPISIIVPAYNEGRLIGATLERLCRLEYPGKEIIVVNDGSGDDTGERIAQVLREFPDVIYVNQSVNGGKARALNTGIARAAHDIVVTIDADTVLSSRSLKHLVLPFFDPDIHATTSNLKVANRNSLLTRWQHLEYTTGVHTERRAQSYLGCITTLSGAACAYRKDAVQRVGGFSSATQVEDTYMTLQMAVTNLPMRFASQAVAYSEAPRTIRGLYQQRFRWLFGSLQCIYLFAGPVLRTSNRAMLWFGYPNFIFNNLLAFLIYPMYFVYLALHFQNLSLSLLFFLLSFLLLETLVSLVACLLARENLRILAHCLPQRNFYGFFLLLIFAASVVALLRKKHPGWRKVRRTGEWLESEKTVSVERSTEGDDG